MSDLVQFKDLYKPFKDFNTKTFDAGKSKVEYKAASAPKSPYKSSVLIDFAKSSYELLLEGPVAPFKTLPAPWANAVLKLKALHPSQGFELTSESKFDGWTITKIATMSPSKRADYNFTAQKVCAEKNINASLAVDWKGADYSSSLALVHHVAKYGVTAGIQGVAKAPGGDFGKLATSGSFALRHRCGGELLGLTVDKKDLVVAWLHKVAGSSHQMFLEVKTATSNVLAKPSFAVGWEDTQKSAPMKARLEVPTGLLQLSYAVPISTQLKATLSSAVPSLDVSKATFGIHVLYDNSI